MRLSKLPHTRGNFDSLLMASFLGLTRANFFWIIFSWWDIVFSAYIFLTRTQKFNHRGFVNKNVSKSYQSYPSLRYLLRKFELFYKQCDIWSKSEKSAIFSASWIFNPIINELFPARLWLQWNEAGFLRKKTIFFISNFYQKFNFFEHF